MKKLFAIFSIISLALMMGAAPLLTEALDPGAPEEGCTLRANFSIGDDSFVAGQVISSTPLDPQGNADPNYEEGWSVICMLDTVYYATNWIFYIILIVVMIMILYAAFLFLTSSGSPEKAGKATKIITYAIIGMVIGLLARAIPAAVRYIVGIG